MVLVLVILLVVGVLFYHLYISSKELTDLLEENKTLLKAIQYLQDNQSVSELDPTTFMKFDDTRGYPKHNDLYKHFKGNYYKVLELAHHSETNETLVVYQALYAPYKICARPLDMFMSEVDHNKYPDVKQTYRFELVNKGNGNE